MCMSMVWVAVSLCVLRTAQSSAIQAEEIQSLETRLAEQTARCDEAREQRAMMQADYTPRPAWPGLAAAHRDVLQAAAVSDEQYAHRFFSRPRDRCVASAVPGTFFHLCTAWCLPFIAISPSRCLSRPRTALALQRVLEFATTGPLDTGTTPQGVGAPWMSPGRLWPGEKVERFAAHFGWCWVGGWVGWRRSFAATG